MATDFYNIEDNLNVWAERVFALDCDISQFIKIYREHTQPWVWTSMKKSSEEISLYGEFKAAEEN